jgi:hypothetical protein
MQRFKNILLVLNSDLQETAALDKAVSLARKNRGRLRGLMVSHTMMILTC